MALNCEIIVNSDVEHLQQIYAGYKMLHDKGIVQLKQTIPAEFLQDRNNPDRWVNYKFSNTRVVINDKISVCYDTHDWNWIDQTILRDVDFYFKRSFDENYLAGLDEQHKVFPLGLNYQVTGDKADFFRLKRAAFYQGKDKIRLILKALRLDNFLPISETERIDRMQAAPDFSAKSKILFMARAWDTENIRDQSQKEIVKEINETRAESVRALRREFGENFFGGLAHDDFSEKHYRDVLLPDRDLSDKQKYLQLLKDFPICVATKGLNNSNGWKLGEYVAFSKAIVTEPLSFKVPGNFEKEKNYLEFSDPKSLVNCVSRLFEDKNLRDFVMKNNQRYYQNFLRPDALVLNTLRVVADQSGLSL